MRRFYRGQDMARIQSVTEMMAAARRRLPGFAAEYLFGGAEDELTLAANRNDFSAIRLHSRTLIANAPPHLQTELAGSRAAYPFAIGPSGYNGMLWPQADIELARAAASRGIPFCLSMVANASLEEVRRAVPQADLWFQLYPLRDSALNDSLLQRARDAGVSTLVITSDALVVGNREWDRRNFIRPRQLTLANKLSVLLHPRWLWRVMVPHGLPLMGNLSPYLPAPERTALGSMDFIARQLDTQLDWDKVARLRRQWPGQMVLKGVLNSADVLRAAACGLDAVVISNHGGRQLDGAPSSVAALAMVAPAVKGRIRLLLDSGIRRGADIVKARALGADGVLLARATLAGVAAGGADGAGRVVDILAEETARCLQLMGHSDVRQLRREDLILPEWMCHGREFIS